MTDFVRKICVVLFAVALSACAGVGGYGKVEHGFDVTNKSARPISKVDIHYGNIVLHFCEIKCVPGAGSFEGVYMPIQDAADVSWKTADGHLHQAHIAIRQRISDLRRFSTVVLEFNDDQLVSFQYLRNSVSGLAGFEKEPLLINGVRHDICARLRSLT